MLGLRSAEMVYRHPKSRVSVTLYPMVHVGERSFYERTYREAFQHDVTLVEGIRSSVGRNLTRAYRWLDPGRLGLVVQPPSPPQNEVSSRIVKADLSAREFLTEWREIALPIRAFISIMAPMMGLYLRFRGSRASLAQRLSLDDLRSSEELLRWQPSLDPLDGALLRARDQRLLECLWKEVENESQKRVAIVYGAMHVRAVVRELRQREFRPESATWRTVFTI